MIYVSLCYCMDWTTFSQKLASLFPTGYLSHLWIWCIWDFFLNESGVHFWCSDEVK